MTIAMIHLNLFFFSYGTGHSLMATLVGKQKFYVMVLKKICFSPEKGRKATN
jgi:hypothetical protein